MTKKKLELKGQNASRIKPKKKEKMQATLKTMQETREADARNLRDIAEAKLKWAENEREKRIKNIESLQKNLQQLQLQIVKLDGVILAYEELLGKKEQKKEE